MKQLAFCSASKSHVDSWCKEWMFDTRCFRFINPLTLVHQLLMQAGPLLASTALISQSRNVPRIMFHSVLELLRLRARCPRLRVSAWLPPPLAMLATDTNFEYSRIVWVCCTRRCVAVYRSGAGLPQKVVYTTKKSIKCLRSRLQTFPHKFHWDAKLRVEVMRILKPWIAVL